MLNAYLRAQAAVQATIATVLSLVADRRSIRRAALTSRYGLAAARGVTFIEYALLAAIAVFISWLFRGQLTSVFNLLLGKLTGAVNNNAG